MDETIMNTVEEQSTMPENDVGADDALKVEIEEQLQKISRHNMLLGAQTVCNIILQKIAQAMNRPGKRTMNDYKRVIKDIEKFCSVGVSRMVNADGDTEADEAEAETVQN